MMTLDDRLDDLRRKKGEPDQPADIVFGDALALPDLGHRGDPARHQIVEPAMRPSHSFQQSRVRLLGLSPIAIEDEAQLYTAPFDLHRDETRDNDANLIRDLRGWGKLVDDGDFYASWTTASSLFKSNVPEDHWTQQVGPARKGLGAVLSRKLMSSRYATTLPGAPDGQYVVIKFLTSFRSQEIGHRDRHFDAG
jgi:hypothetical protein